MTILKNLNNRITITATPPITHDNETRKPSLQQGLSVKRWADIETTTRQQVSGDKGIAIIGEITMRIRYDRKIVKWQNEGYTLKVEYAGKLYNITAMERIMQDVGLRFVATGRL